MVWKTAVTTVLTKMSDPEDTSGSFLDQLSYALSSVYNAEMEPLLYYSQMAALLEIVHAFLRLVRSPVLVTAMQVSSRIVALIAIVHASSAQSKYPSKDRDGLTRKLGIQFFLNNLSVSDTLVPSSYLRIPLDQWGAGVMILSWASVEVPRYLFYVAALVTGDATKKTPYVLFWLRYSLFAVLYPTGIMGEMSVFRKAATDAAFVQSFSTVAATFYGVVLPIVYFFGSPFMIFNMVANRKSAFKKRFAKPPPPPRGLCWPVDSKGQRSSTEVNKAIVAAAVGAVNSDKAQAILKCKSWRFSYGKHLRALVEEQCKSPEAALKIAEAGLAKAYELFEFIDADGSAVSFEEAMNAKNTDKFCTGFVQGTGTKRTEKLEVPYKGEILSGQRLKDQIQAWVDYGTIEPSCGDAMIKCVDNPKWLDVSNRYFVLLGAGSAMGPLHVLMALGANIIAIDLDRPNIWKRLIGIARASSGSITFPLKVEQKTCTTDDELFAAAGCNLFTHTPMIRDWLLDLYPKNKPFTVGSYAYLDGALHVQVSLAMDAICRDLSEKRKGTSLAYLCTPTDLHLIPKEAHDDAEAYYKEYSKKLYCKFYVMERDGFKSLEPSPHVIVSLSVMSFL